MIGASFTVVSGISVKVTDGVVKWEALRVTG